MSHDKQQARERLERAEEEFAELTDGRGLLDQDGTTYRMYDGEEVRGVEAAAKAAERHVRFLRGGNSS